MQDITLLDGGLGQEIIRRSHADKAHPLWSVKTMFDEPDVIKQVHKDFIAAGAKVLSVNNYTATPTRMLRNDMMGQFEQAHETAIQLLKSAISESDKSADEITIAGCLPPLTASYVADAALDYQPSYDEYCRLIEVQKDHVDVILVETMSNSQETFAAVDALTSFGEKTYISLTLSDDLTNCLRSGETLEAVIERLSEKNIDAVMINCSFPEAVSKALPILAQSDLRFGAYANGFTSISALQPGGTVDGLHARTDLPPEIYASHALSWIDAGATIIGGCCEITPSHIAYLAKEMHNHGYRPSQL